jgi:hypothetical protein
MRSTGAMGMRGLDNKTLPQHRSFDVDLQSCGPTCQTLRNEEVNAFELMSLVAAQILALCVGVDRHLSDLASPHRGDEVDGNRPAPLARKIQRCLCDTHLHVSSMTDFPSSRSVGL